MDKHTVKVVKGDEMVGHLPREFSRIAWYFLRRSGEISVEVIGRRQHCKQLCGGMEVPCQLQFNCSNKKQMRHLKELLASKIQVYNILYEPQLLMKALINNRVSVCLIFIY